MSEPIDLIAGKHVGNPEAPDMAKAAYNASEAPALPSTGGVAKESTAAEVIDISAMGLSKGHSHGRLYVDGK